MAFSYFVKNAWNWPQNMFLHPQNSHHHHWLDSPWWALAFLRSCAHSSLLRATFFQFLTPDILISWSTLSSYRNFGLPTLHALSSLVLNIFLIVLSLFIHTKCPAHASLLTLNISSLGRQRCLPSWGPQRTPWFFFVISQLFDAVNYSNYGFWVSETIIQWFKHC